MDPFVLCLILFVAAILAFPVLFQINKHKLGRELEEEEKKVQDWKEKIFAEREKINQQVKEGTWEFPVEPFYAACKEASVTTLETEYGISKAKLIASDIMFNAGVYRDNQKLYLKPHVLKKYFAEGQILAGDTVKQQKQPRDASPTEEERTFIRRAAELAPLSGIDKRREMLAFLWGEYSTKIRAVQEGQEALMQLGMIYAGQQQKEGDWAIVGGIASGIAGPIAGIMAASETIANNSKIREHNEAMRKASMDIMSGIPSLAGNEFKLERERDEISKQQMEIWNKVVLSSITSEDIWANIQLGKPEVKKNASGVLAVSLPVSIKKPFILDVPENIVMVVDGTIKGEVWFEDKLVGEVFFPLPLYGIPTNMTADVTLDGMCGRFVKYDGKYTVKIADKQSLWIMEA